VKNLINCREENILGNVINFAIQNLHKDHVFKLQYIKFV